MRRKLAILMMLAVLITGCGSSHSLADVDISLETQSIESAATGSNTDNSEQKIVKITEAEAKRIIVEYYENSGGAFVQGNEAFNSLEVLYPEILNIDGTTVDAEIFLVGSFKGADRELGNTETVNDAIIYHYLSGTIVDGKLEVVEEAQKPIGLDYGIFVDDYPYRYIKLGYTGVKTRDLDELRTIGRNAITEQGITKYYDEDYVITIEKDIHELKEICGPMLNGALFNIIRTDEGFLTTEEIRNLPDDELKDFVTYLLDDKRIADNEHILSLAGMLFEDKIVKRAENGLVKPKLPDSGIIDSETDFEKSTFTITYHPWNGNEMFSTNMNGSGKNEDNYKWIIDNLGKNPGKITNEDLENKTDVTGVDGLKERMFFKNWHHYMVENLEKDNSKNDVFLEAVQKEDVSTIRSIATGNFAKKIGKMSDEEVVEYLAGTTEVDFIDPFNGYHQEINGYSDRYDESVIVYSGINYEDFMYEYNINYLYVKSGLKNGNWFIQDVYKGKLANINTFETVQEFYEDQENGSVYVRGSIKDGNLIIKDGDEEVLIETMREWVDYNADGLNVELDKFGMTDKKKILVSIKTDLLNQDLTDTVLSVKASEVEDYIYSKKDEVNVVSKKIADTELDIYDGIVKQTIIDIKPMFNFGPEGNFDAALLSTNYDQELNSLVFNLTSDWFELYSECIDEDRLELIREEWVMMMDLNFIDSYEGDNLEENSIMIQKEAIDTYIEAKSEDGKYSFIVPLGDESLVYEWD